MEKVKKVIADTGYTFWAKNKSNPAIKPIAGLSVVYAYG